MNFVSRNRRRTNASSPSLGSLGTSQNQTTRATSRNSPSPSDDTWQDVDISSSDYACKHRVMMALNSDLQGMGAGNFIDLPSIVVIGGQSAGKSSLVEAVSGINVPRDSGTCTRCPMVCSMSSTATTWSCTVSLRFTFDQSGQNLPKLETKPFGGAITERSEMEIWLRRAQAALLNPSVDQREFYRKTVSELKEMTPRNTLKFSKNAVVVSIKDPGATDVSFVDLPGLIQNDSLEVVDLVRGLVNSEIERPNTIILVTIPMSDDMENQGAMQLAKKADPNGERTIGVLTKPDTLGSGAISARKKWHDIIEGHDRDHALALGYYCVRLPDDSERSSRLSRSELQQRAATFFDTTAPWNEVADRGRFGIPAFVKDISRLLIKLMEKSLPKLKEDVEKLLASCNEELGSLPAPLATDPQVEVVRKISAFCDAYKAAVFGTGSDKSLAQQNRALYELLKRNIRGTAPDFRPFEQPVHFVPFDDLNGAMVLSERDPGVSTMGVYEVRKVIKESIGWELPNNIPFEAKTRLIAQFTNLWGGPTEQCFTNINKVLMDVVDKLILEHFGRYKVLEAFARNKILSEIEKCCAEVHSAVRETLANGTVPSYTQNTHYLQSLRTQWFHRYKMGRHRPEDFRIDRHVECVETVHVHSPDAWERPEVAALRHLAQAGYKGLRVEDLVRLLPPDGFEDELTVMADVRAYFHVAYKRVIDVIPLKIEHALHQELTHKFSLSLLQGVMGHGVSEGNQAGRMKELVSDDPAIVQKRERLEARKSRLLEIQRKLSSFMS
ncbi:hypothetical protein BS17DRAFT_810582 [Gyrodon lividus]|nr:hypothetical protein BS17DRAFT_810582 [Gyrodon lividus]